MDRPTPQLNNCQTHFGIHRNEDIHLVQNRRRLFSSLPRSPYVPGLSNKPNMRSSQRGSNRATRKPPQKGNRSITYWDAERSSSAQYSHQEVTNGNYYNQPCRKRHSSCSIEGRSIGASRTAFKKRSLNTEAFHAPIKRSPTNLYRPRISTEMVDNKNALVCVDEFPSSNEHGNSRRFTSVAKKFRPGSPPAIVKSRGNNHNCGPLSTQGGTSSARAERKLFAALTQSSPSSSLTTPSVHEKSIQLLGVALIGVALLKSNVKAAKTYIQNKVAIIDPLKSLDEITVDKFDATSASNLALVQISPIEWVHKTQPDVASSAAETTTTAGDDAPRICEASTSGSSPREESCSTESTATPSHLPSTTSASVDIDGTLCVSLGSIGMPFAGAEEIARFERKNRRATVIEALSEAEEALQNPASEIEYLVVLHEKLSRYLYELTQAELGYRHFIKKDQLENELQIQRALQDRGTEATCRLQLKVDSMRKDCCSLRESKDDAKLNKLIRLLNLSSPNLSVVASNDKERREKDTNKSYDKESLTESHVDREVQCGHIAESHRVQLVSSTAKSDDVGDNIEEETVSCAGAYRPPTEARHELSRVNCSDCFKLFTRDFTQCCHSIYEFSMGTQNTMMLTAGGRFVKYALFLANLAILLGGIVMFSVGAWAFIDSSFMERLIGNDQFITSAATLMASGCVVVVVSLLGCLGAFKEIRCLLIVYFVLLLVVFVTMVVGGIVGYLCRDDVDESVYRAMWASIPLYHNDSTVMKAWDEIQRNFKCCGMRNRGSPKDAPKDAWRRNPNFIGTNMKVPDSCCIRIEWLGGCRKNPTSRDTFMADCHTKVRDFIKSHALALGAVGVAVACLVLLGMAFSCALIIIIR